MTSLLLGCFTIEQSGETSSDCLITFAGMEEVKAQLGKDQANITLAGNKVSVSRGKIIGFYGDWADTYAVIYDPACQFDEKLTAKYNAKSVSIITFTWSSWKDEHVDVYPNQDSPPDGYFNPPHPYAGNN